jgi:hypothetical protein
MLVPSVYTMLPGRERKRAELARTGYCSVTATNTLSTHKTKASSLKEDAIADYFNIKLYFSLPSIRRQLLTSAIHF